MGMTSFFFSACNTIDTTFSGSRQIVAKYRVLDENLSPTHDKCSEIIVPFLEMGRYDCSFKLEHFEFDIERKIILDSAGYLLEEWIYIAEGPMVYDLSMIGEDKALSIYLGINKLPIYMDDNKVIDGLDTLKVTRVFTEQKLVWVKNSPNLLKGRRLLYQYQ